MKDLKRKNSFFKKTETLSFKREIFREMILGQNLGRDYLLVGELKPPARFPSEFEPSHKLCLNLVLLEFFFP